MRQAYARFAHGTAAATSGGRRQYCQSVAPASGGPLQCNALTSPGYFYDMLLTAATTIAVAMTVSAARRKIAAPPLKVKDEPKGTADRAAEDDNGGGGASKIAACCCCCCCDVGISHNTPPLAALVAGAVDDVVGIANGPK